jgi:hypothetical protein
MSNDEIESGSQIQKDAPISDDEAVLAALGRKDLLAVRKPYSHLPSVGA